MGNGVFKRSTSVSGKYKELNIVNGQFCDPETGEEVDVIGELAEVYGTAIFSLSTSYKSDEDVE